MLHCYRIDPQTGQEQRVYTLRSGGYGQYAEETQSIFKKEESYTFQIDWQSSNLGYRPASPGVTAEGPDYDYTFKVQPQGTHTGILIDAYDPKTKTIGNPILAENASDVATTEAEFKQNYEDKRVAVLNPKLEWVAIDGYDNIDDHIDPWSNPIGGKRIFPDFKDPSTTQIRHAVQLIVSGALPGLPVYVKAFDVDDSTSEAFDLDQTGISVVIDTNGKAGDDNLTDYLNTPKNGQFWTGFAWGINSSNKAADSNGQAKFIFRVGMQPGNNYRVVTSVDNESMYSGVQTTNPTSSTYLGPEINQNGNTSASPLLTVWRRLWVENDSMEAIPSDQFGYKRNDLSADTPNPIINAAILNPPETGTIFFISPISDPTSFLNLENGRIIIQGIDHLVTGSGFQVDDHIISVAGNYRTVPVGSVFRLYDDDDFGLNTASLPRYDLVDELMRSFFRPSFIEVTDSGSFNTRKSVPFRKNDDLQSSSVFHPENTVVNVSKDLSEKEAFWVCHLTAAYQFSHDEDKDPFNELPTDGGTRQFEDYEHSTVFVEACRDWYDQAFRLSANGGSPNHAVNARERLKKYISAQASHEIGHQPGTDLVGDLDHAEGGLMRVGGTNPDSPEFTEFAPKTILRFRDRREL